MNVNEICTRIDVMIGELRAGRDDAAAFEIAALAAVAKEEADKREQAIAGGQASDAMTEEAARLRAAFCRADECLREDMLDVF